MKKASRLQISFHENGYGIPEDFPLDWVRLELQLRPRKQQKIQAATEELVNLWGYSNWTREVADDVFSLDVPRVKADEWKQTDDERVMMWVAKQYGNFFTRMLDKKGLGQQWAKKLADMFAKLKRQDREQVTKQALNFSDTLQPVKADGFFFGRFSKKKDGACLGLDG